MSAELEPIRTHDERYTAEVVQLALLTILESGGSAKRAAARLKDQGVEVPERTLQHWRAVQYPNRYAALQTRHGADIEERVIRGMRDNIALADALERDMLEDFAGSYKALDAKDKAGAIRNISTTKAINVDKLLQLTGRPTSITEHRNASDLLAQIAKRVGLPIESTAEEITE